MKSLNVIKRTALCLLFGAGMLAAVSAQKASPYNIAVGVGSTISEARFVWLSSSLGAAEVQIAKESQLKNGNFTTAAYCGSCEQIFATEGILDKPGAMESDTGEYSNKVTVSNLSPDTRYSYRVGDGINWSPVYTFKTASAAKVAFAAFGDPQMGASGDVEHDKAGWLATLKAVAKQHPDVTMLFSAGDQVNDYDSLLKQQNEYPAFFSPDEETPFVQSYQLAADEGNHDLQMGKYYSFHYNQPNLSTLGQTVSAGIENKDGDYSFIYGPALFIMLEGNNFYDTAAHDEFMASAIAAAGGTKWIIVSFHQAPYSEANHAMAKDPDDDVMFMRQNWTRLMDKYHVDVVINGHDHYYTRSFQMLRGMPVSTKKVSSVSNPKGTLYLTLDSATGSKYYKFNTNSDHSFSACGWQNNQPTYSYITITARQFTVTTYISTTGAKIDSYTISKR